MYLDVVDLRAFYYRTKLGRSAQRALQEALRRVWPETRALTVVGFGFAAPMLRRFDRMDANNDGIVTPEERSAARAARKNARSQ